MKYLGLHYIASLIAILGIFRGFVACGAQKYKVSLVEDTGATIDGRRNEIASQAPKIYGLHSPGGWAQLPIHFKIGTQLNPDQLKALDRAMNTWETAIGKKLFVYEGVHVGTTGDSFPDLYSSLTDSINGCYTDDHWDKTGKPSVVLATTIWDSDPKDPSKILTADIRFNSDYYNIGDSLVIKSDGKREVADMQTLSLHELGHLLGLAHIDANVDPQSIMNPALFIGEGLANRRLSKGDVLRIQSIYGCLGESCEVDKILAALDAKELSQRRAKIDKGPSSTESSTR